MRILTVENTVFALEQLPEQVDDLRFSVLDNSDPDNPDYFFIPLVFLESFNSPAAVLRIGNSVIKVPIDWSILIGDKEVGDLEVLPITSLNERGFKVFTFNPLSDFRPDFAPVEIIDIYPEIRWYFPKLKSGQLLTVPISDKNKPNCVFLVKDISRQCEIVDVQKVW